MEARRRSSILPIELPGNPRPSQHDGLPPQTHAEKVAFKQAIHNLKLKSDEENFDEAQAQAYRSWTETKVPTGVAELFHDPRLETLDASCMPIPSTTFQRS